MKEWFKKYLGWVGFGVWVALTLIAWLGRETEHFAYALTVNQAANFVWAGLVFMAGANVIHEILNEKYLTKYSKKVKNGMIIFIVTIIIGAFYLLKHRQIFFF